MIVAGLDPGKNGALVTLFEDGSTLVCRVPLKEGKVRPGKKSAARIPDEPRWSREWTLQLTFDFGDVFVLCGGGQHGCRLRTTRKNCQHPRSDAGFVRQAGANSRGAGTGQFATQRGCEPRFANCQCVSSGPPRMGWEIAGALDRVFVAS